MMTLFTALHTAIAAMRTIVTTLEQLPPDDDGARTKVTLREAEDVMVAHLASLLVKEMLEGRAAEAGFPPEIVERAKEALNSKGLDYIKETGREYQRRMIAAGLDPDALMDRINAAIERGDQKGAQAIFKEIREAIDRHEATKQ